MEHQSDDHHPIQKFQAAADEALQRYRERAQELDEARASLSKIGDRIEALERNAQAAQTEADAAKAAWTARLRDGDGTLTKEVQKHRAAERSAYTLVEEYDVIRKELQRQFDLQNVAVAAVAYAYEEAYWHVLKTKADLALDRAIERVGLELGVARRLHDRSTRSSNELVPLSSEMLRDRFMARIDRLLATRSEEVSAALSSELDGVVLDLSSVDMRLMRSPMSRKQQLRELAATA